jgi:catechol 2,3-dioxygenase-like lactoylglutathione lyase family enzyme
MITAVHTLVFAEDADEARAFFRDVLRFPGVDAGGGWLIFKTGPSELAVHPTDGPPGDAGTAAEQFDVSLVCDDLAETMAELSARGAEFVGGTQRQSWGTMVRLKVPGAGEMTLYQPAYDPPATSTSI